MKHSKTGIPILCMKDKLAALAYCIEAEADEDAAGHLCDLLAYVRDKLDNSKLNTLKKIVAYYGANPTPIEE